MAFAKVYSIGKPECKPNKYRLGAFTEDGRPTEIMDAFMP